MNEPPVPNRTLEDYRYLRLSEVLALVPVSRSSWHAGVAAGKYPRAVSWGPRTRAYAWSAIRRLLEDPEGFQLTAGNATRTHEVTK